MSFTRTLLSRPSIAKLTTPRAMSFSTFVVTPPQLSLALSLNPPLPHTPRTIPLSAEWFLPNDPQQRTGPSEFLLRRIPTARFFDLDAVKDPNSPYPHMLPPPAVFSSAMGALGITKADTVVVYDSPSLGIFSAPRAAWTLRVFGHQKVHLLNNFKAWVEEGLPVETGPYVEPVGVEYGAVEMDAGMVDAFEDVKAVAEGVLGGRGMEGVQVLDARPGGRFRGVDPEPRPGLSSGHVPGAISVPFSELVDPVSKKLKPGKELREVLLRLGVDPRPEVEKKLMCGTGVTAVVIETALELAAIPGKRVVYDGSWTEWAQRVTADSGLIVKETK